MWSDRLRTQAFSISSRRNDRYPDRLMTGRIWPTAARHSLMGSTPFAAVVHSASDIWCSRLLKTTYRAFPALSLAYPAPKPLKPPAGPISGLGGAFLPTFFIAKPLRGCLRGRSGRARGPQATGGPGGGTPRRARSALGAGRVGHGGTTRPPLGGTIEGRGSREAGEPRRGAPCR